VQFNEKIEMASENAVPVAVSESESDEEDNLFLADHPKINQDFKRFEKLMKQRQRHQSNLQVKVDLNPKKTSEVWRYFGSLYYSNRKVYHDKCFCKICVDESFVLTP
jgi:hypothetical protein